MGTKSFLFAVAFLATAMAMSQRSGDNHRTYCLKHGWTASSCGGNPQDVYQGTPPGYNKKPTDEACPGCYPTDNRYNGPANNPNAHLLDESESDEKANDDGKVSRQCKLLQNLGILPEKGCAAEPR